MHFEDWVVNNKQRAASTANKYRGAIYGRLSEMAVKHGLIGKKLYEIHSVSEFNSVRSRLLILDEFSELNTRGNNMYSCSLEMYAQYIEAKER